MYLGPDIYQYLLTFLKPDNTCKECINSRKDIQTYVNYCIVFNLIQVLFIQIVKRTLSWIMIKINIKTRFR